MTKWTRDIVVAIIVVVTISSCSPTQYVAYDLRKYKDNGQPYIPIYNPLDPEWVRAEHILKDIVAPANWGSKRHQFAGLDYVLYIRTTKKNQAKINQALPTLWRPN